MKDFRGFSIIEVLVAVAIVSILMTGLLKLYNSMYRSADCGALKTEAHQNLSAGIEFIRKDVALTGYKVTGSAQAIAVATPSVFTFRYVDDAASSDMMVSYFAQSTGGVRSLYHGVCVDTGWTGVCTPVVEPVVDNLDPTNGLTFTYYDKKGIATTVGADIRYVEVLMTVVTSKECLTDDGSKPQRQSILSKMRLRNIL